MKNLWKVAAVLAIATFAACNKSNSSDDSALLSVLAPAAEENERNGMKPATESASEPGAGEVTEEKKSSSED